MGMLLFWGFAGAFLLSAAVTPLVRRMAPALGLIDLPGHRKVHVIPTPRGGGIAIFLGVMLPAVLLLGGGGPGLAAAVGGATAGLRLQLLAIGAGGVVLFLTGLADDRWSLSWKLRLCVQLLVAAGVAGSGVRATVFVSQPWFGFGLTVLWILVLTNAMNFLDNMDGLSAGIGLIAALLFASILLLMVERVVAEVALLLLLLAGSLGGFLVWNRPPAAIFMGDCGSNLIGFLLATLTVAGTFYERSGSRHVMLAPLCVMAVPLYDFCTVILIRLKQGRSPFHGDKSHVSHRLVDLGLKPVYAVLTVHLMTAMTGACALLLYKVPDWWGAAIVMSVILMVLGVVAILEFVGRGAVGEMQGRLQREREQFSGTDRT
ncbi:MAG: MraY family glycosyltransferase [Planctomycetaceae bacterium]